MIRVEVPARKYRLFLEAWPKSAWAWAEVVPGKSYRVHYQPWDALRALEAERILDTLRKVLAKN